MCHVWVKFLQGIKPKDQMVESSTYISVLNKKIIISKFPLEFNFIHTRSILTFARCNRIEILGNHVANDQWIDLVNP